MFSSHMLFSAFDKAKLDDSRIYLPGFLSRTNLKLYNIDVIPKLVKKIITNVDSSNVSGPGCIPVFFSEEMWAWNFIHTRWTLWLFKRILFLRSSEGLICDPCI